MSGLTADIHGPISLSLWNRLRRRPRHLGATAAAGAVTVLLATEPNLSGIWVDAEGVAREIYHKGGSVRATLMSGTHSFAASFVGERRLEGSINLFPSGRLAEVCPRGFQRVSGDFSMEIYPDFDTIVITYTNYYYSEENCSFDSAARESKRLTRRED